VTRRTISPVSNQFIPSAKQVPVLTMMMLLGVFFVMCAAATATTGVTSSVVVCSDDISILAGIPATNDGWNREHVVQRYNQKDLLPSQSCIHSTIVFMEDPAIAITDHKTKSTVPRCGGKYNIPYPIGRLMDRIALDLDLTAMEGTGATATTPKLIIHNDNKITPCSTPQAWSETVEQTDYVVSGASSMPTDSLLSILIPLEEPTSVFIIKDATNIDMNHNSKLYYVRSYKTTAITTMDAKDEFCKDTGMMRMVMYMRGFHWSTITKQGNVRPCLNYYFGRWGLVDVSSFKGAMVYSFLLALLTQGLVAVQAVVVSHVTRGRKKKLLLLLIYVVQSFMGYLLMLIAMSFSLELLLSIVLGVMVGNRLFVTGDEREGKQWRNEDLQTTSIDCPATILSDPLII